jgi:K+-sensing histidine kinase KdpD
MEKILAAMDPATTHFSAGIHALDLARRIHAKVLFLLIHSSGESKVETTVQKQLADPIEEARADGITVEYYVTHGTFESELVSFVRENRITLLVIESPMERDDADGAFLDKIRHRLHCRIEVVNEKPNSLGRKE